MNDTVPFQAPDAATDAAATKPIASAAELPPLKPRAGTIVWGFLLLVVGAIAILFSQFDVGSLGAEVFVWSVVGFGAALVLAALITAVAKAARSRARE
jgi:predicted phage tail protein